jgi:excisionase family DNA binding protein
MKEEEGIRFLSPTEFTKLKGLTRSTVYEAIRDGSLPHIRLSKRKILIPEDALERRMKIAIPNAKTEVHSYE